MTSLEMRLFRFILGVSSNGTRCRACQDLMESASKIVAEIRPRLTYDECIELGYMLQAQALRSREEAAEVGLDDPIPGVRCVGCED